MKESTYSLLTIINIFIDIEDYYFDNIKDKYITDLFYKNNLNMSVMINYLINDMTREIILLPDNAIKIIKDKVNNITLPDMTIKDKQVSDSNDLLYNKVKSISIILLVCTIIIIYYVSSYYNLSSDEIQELVIKSVLLLLCIGLVEFIFLNLIVKNYYSVDMNKIKRHIILKLKTLQKN
jgi:hypothetical protein